METTEALPVADAAAPWALDLVIVLQGVFDAPAAATAPEPRLMETTEAAPSGEVGAEVAAAPAALRDSAEPEESEPSEESDAIELAAESLALALANGTSPGPVEFVSLLLVSRDAVGGAPRALMLWKVPDMSL